MSKKAKNSTKEKELVKINLYKALDYAYAERCLYESNRRRFLFDCTPFELYKY